MLGRSETFFDHLIEALQTMDHYAGVLKVVKASQSVPPSAEQWDRLMSATVAIAGFGGCSSCSARSIRDSIELEWAGVPTVYVGHHTLAPSARAVARPAGHAEYPMLLVDNPYPTLATWSDSEGRRLAAARAPIMREQVLTGGRTGTLVGSTSAWAVMRGSVTPPRGPRIDCSDVDALIEDYCDRGWMDGHP